MKLLKCSSPNTYITASFCRCETKTRRRCEWSHALIFFTLLLACMTKSKHILASRQPEDHFATLIYLIPYGWRLRLMFNWVCKMKLLFLTTARVELNCNLFVTKCVQLTPFMLACLLYWYAKWSVQLPHTSLLRANLKINILPAYK